MKQGEEIRLVDQEGKGNIYMFEDNSLENLKFVEEIYFAKNKVKKTLIASLIRSERLEWMIQKACELGVDEIYLYQSDLNCPLLQTLEVPSSTVLYQLQILSYLHYQ